MIVSYKDHKALIIDDDQAFRSRLAKAFTARGLIVEQASDLKSTLTILKSFPANLIILDMKLEHESGLQILQEIKKINSTAKILILTGYGTISTAVESIKLGADHYLTKPANADAILSAFDLPVEKTAKIPVPALEQVEWEYINKVIEQCAGNISKAAKLLGLHRRSLQRKIKKQPENIV